jgi:hypothetical protein
MKYSHPQQNFGFGTEIWFGHMCVFRIIRDILSEIEKSIEEKTLLKNFSMKVLPALHVKLIELAELLVNIPST